MNVSFSADDLAPLVRTIVSQVLERMEADQERLGSKLAYPEAQAAELLNVAPHVLRDARLRGEISGSLVGKKIVYERTELLDFLRRQRCGGVLRPGSRDKVA